MEQTWKRSDQEHIVLDVADASKQETQSIPLFDCGLGFTHRRLRQFNSRRYIFIEITTSVIYIIATIVVLALSRNENPQAVLTVWLVGYASGCLAILPILCLRYSRRLCEFVELFKIPSDCFFVGWNAYGVLLIRYHLSSSDAPTHYRLFIAFVTLGSIGIVIKVILSISAWFCLPHIIFLLGDSEDQTQTRGFSYEIVGALPENEFKAKKSTGGNGSKDGCKNHPESSGEDGIIAGGTDKGSSVSTKDEMCCICLRTYKDDVHLTLRELPRAHYFHVECYDKWSKINASCTLCKHGIGESVKQHQNLLEI